jgi:hypothetical protein
MPPVPYRLLVEPLDLGPDVRAISLDLSEKPAEGEEEETPARGEEPIAIWAAAIPALASIEPWALDFFSHLDAVRGFCLAHHIGCREAASRCVVISRPEPEALVALIARFETETFGFRAGSLLEQGDAALENDLSRRGVDAYQPVFSNYAMCGICDFENGSLTLLSEKISSTEVVRRLRPALSSHSVRIERPA